MRMHTAEILASHPDVQGSITQQLIDCIDECHACAQACLSCADACLAEENTEALKQCIRVCLDCADLCDATAKLASRRTGSNEQLMADLLDVCATACRACATECDEHADMHDHCRICAEACRDCENSCQEAMTEVMSKDTADGYASH
jgi:hypothetical protein